VREAEVKRRREERLGGGGELLLGWADTDADGR